MTDTYFKYDSREFKDFYDNSLQPQLRKIEYANNYAQAKFKKRLIYSLNIFFLLLLLNFLFHSALSLHYTAVIRWFDNIVMSYHTWYLSKSFYLRIFLPSKLFFNSFPSPLKLAILSIFILPIWCIAPFLRADINKPNIFQDFFKFFDAELQTLTYQKLKYIGDLEQNSSLPFYQNLSLDDNLEIKINNQLIDIAQIKLTVESKNTLKILNLLTAKNVIVYRGLLLSAIIPYTPGRFVKIFIDSKDLIDFLNLQDLHKAVLINKIHDKRVNIFSSNPDSLQSSAYIDKILYYADILQQNNFPSSVHLDQSIKNKLNHNITESYIRSYNYIEVTILENRIMVLIPSNHKLLDFYSVFRTTEISNDANFLFSAINLLIELTKR